MSRDMHDTDESHENEIKCKHRTPIIKLICVSQLRVHSIVFESRGESYLDKQNIAKFANYENLNL